MKFVTGNLKKWEEANAILGGGLERIELDLEEIQSLDVREVVEHKVKTAYAQIGEPVLVEDIALTFDAWNGLPGPLIKWYREAVNMEGILKMLAGFEHRGAVATCCVGYYDGKNIQYFMGELRGTIAPEMRGRVEFGWDPIFIPDGYEQTYGEMDKSLKNQISHRFLAWEKVKEKFC